MNYKKIIAAASVLTLFAGMASGCGKETENPGDTSELSVVTENNTESNITESNNDKENSVTETAPEKNDKKTTSAKEDKSTDNVTTAAATTAKSGNSSGGGNTGGSGSSGNSGASGNSGSSGNSGGGEAPSSGGETSSGEESSYTAEVTFGSSPSIKGSNASVDGKIVRITAGGDYLIRGKSGDAQVYVATATEEKVTLILDDLDIACSDGPAINIAEAKRCTIKLAEGSSNYLRDGGTDKINDGVIFSNDTLRFKGSGYLEINSGNAHGIASDDDVIIEDGRYLINSIKSGIFAHDDITVNGGDLNVYGGTNGIKSKGTVNINGGKAVISGGSKEEKSSIYSAAAFTYTGGTVFAAGNKVTAPASTPNPYIVASFGDTILAGTELKLYLNGGEQVNFRPHNDFRCVIMLTPDIYEGSVFSASLNGDQTEDFETSAGQNVFQIG